MERSARNELAKFGISIEVADYGAIELVSRRGVKCAYSSRVYSPVIGFGADGRIYIRLTGNRIAQLRIDGETFEHSSHGSLQRMAVHK